MICLLATLVSIIAVADGLRLNMLADGRKALMGGNWKLNPITISEANSLATGLVELTKDVSTVDAIIFPPMPFVHPVGEKLAGSNIMLGGQDCYTADSGAFTGATSTSMLTDIGASYVLCGHSERRTLFKEDDSVVGAKVDKCLAAGLKPVLCIGETKEEYEAGKNQEVCANQISKNLANVTPEQMLNVVIAYEPVWAIGTGLVCPPDVAQDVHAFIRSEIRKKYGDDVAKKTIIQYGGSVKPDNVKELMSMPDIDGALVGGASLDAAGFAKIIGYEKL
jgi:triosephosphate isomerase